MDEVTSPELRENSGTRDLVHYEKFGEAADDFRLCDPSELPVPDWHRELLAERRRRIESGEATISSWEDAKKRLNELGNED